jgi:DNA uptake protein ComE-like DNA-binding protein
VSNVLLAAGGQRAENGAVRILAQIAALAALSLCLSGLGQTPAGARQAPGTAAIPAPELRVDINRATQGELLRLPGMTPSWAGRIVRFRPYRTKLDLLEKGVVSDQVYDRIKDYVIAHREK